MNLRPPSDVVHRVHGIAQFLEVQGGALKLKFGEGQNKMVLDSERSKVSRLKAADAADPPKLTVSHTSAGAHKRHSISWHISLTRLLLKKAGKHGAFKSTK
jgi:hypothetical protein